MSYKKTTRFYRLPYISEGEALMASEEERRAIILDNMLYASTCGVSKALFEDGDYDVVDNKDGTYTLVIIPSGNYSLLGIINYRLFYSRDVVTLTSLQNGLFYYVYVSYNDKMDIDPTKFQRVATTTMKHPTSELSILIATIDLTGAVPVVNDEPEEKIYSKDLLAHTHDQSNPHGRVLHQDSLIIHDSLLINDSVVCGAIYKDVVTAGNNTFTRVDVFNKKVKFVSCMGCCSGLGEVWFRLGDGFVDFYNAGGSGLSCVLKIEVC